MSLQGFQQALSELVLSSDFRSQVADGGAAALGAFDLDPREKRRVLAIADQSGLKTGVLIHRSFRLSMQTRSLPRTCQLLGARLSDPIHDFWQKHLPLHYNFVWESCRFAGYLRGLMKEGSLVDPLLEDVLRIDLASMALQRGLPLEQVDLDPRPSGADVVEVPDSGGLVIVCKHDPGALLADLDANERPNPPSGNYQLLIRKTPAGGLHYEST